jgi:hypothetical protein
MNVRYCSGWPESDLTTHDRKWLKGSEERMAAFVIGSLEF